MGGRIEWIEGYVSKELLRLNGSFHRIYNVYLSIYSKTNRFIYTSRPMTPTS